MDISLDAETLKRVEESHDPSEIAQLCLKAGLACGDLAKDTLENIVVNTQPPIISQKIGAVDFDDRSTMDGNNPPPSSLEFLK